MPDCLRGVTFPLKKLIESILHFSGDTPEDAYFSFSSPNIPNSKETETLLRILIDRHGEQFRFCGGDEKDISKRVGDYESNILHTKFFGYLKNTENVAGPEGASAKSLFLEIEGDPQKMQMGELSLFFVDRRHNMGALTLFIMINFSRRLPYQPSFKVDKIQSLGLKKVLDAFDPMGTGYDFFTPDDLKAYEARYPTPESRQGHTLISPELRYNRTVPSLKRMLMRNFNAKQYPEGQTEAFKAYERNLILDGGDDQGEDNDNKRRRIQWAVGATGYHLN